MGEQIPIPSHALSLSKQMKATEAIQRIKLENILLKHLVNILDPEHDYMMDLEKMTLTKVRNDKVRSSSSKKLEGRQKNPTAPTAGGLTLSDIQQVGAKPAKEEDIPQ